MSIMKFCRGERQTGLPSTFLVQILRERGFVDLSKGAKKVPKLEVHLYHLKNDA